MGIAPGIPPFSSIFCRVKLRAMIAWLKERPQAIPDHLLFATTRRYTSNLVDLPSFMLIDFPRGSLPWYHGLGAPGALSFGGRWQRRRVRRAIDKIQILAVNISLPTF